MSLLARTASQVYLVTKESTDLLKMRFRHLFETKVRLIDATNSQSDANDAHTDQRLAVVVNGKSEDIAFDTKTYFSNLKTERLGQWMAFADVTDTTMKLIESFKGVDGFVAVSNQQTSGRGRTQNEWLSPKGCAMFTLQVVIDMHSNIGRKIAFFQHMVGLSIVRAINTIPGYEQIDLALKWPNDILWRKNGSKISGVLITCSFINQSFNVLVGCGINVSNRKPSVCLNDVIDDYNSHSSNKLDYLKSEEVIARTLTQLEELLKLSDQDDGLKTIEELYLKSWLHSGQVITMMDNKYQRSVRIEGLDPEGYLLVKDVADGSTLSLHPDGNRFDLMRNLITPRKLN